MEADDWFTLQELAGRLGALVWVEERLHEVLADWSAVDSHAQAAIVFSTTASHHRWHGEVIADCLPTSPQLNEAELVAAPTQGWADAVAAMRGLRAPDATATRLRVLTKVIDPWLDRETAALRELSRPISDAPLLRWLRFVCLDHDDARSTAAALLANQTSAVRLDDHVALNEMDLTR